MVKSILEIKETGSHYTSSLLSKYMAKKLLEHVEFEEGKLTSVLDPSCGDGELLRAIYNEGCIENLELIGMDTDPKAIQLANQYLGGTENVHLFNSDYLALFNDSEDLFADPTIKNDFWFSSDEFEPKKVDMILANPPYVRTQVLGAKKAQELGEKFNLKGRVDLYQVFLVAMTKHLKEDGLICVITSNRYLTTVGGKDTRKFLDENYEIIEVIDLGDTKLFSAAVLPAIFIGRKKSAKNKKPNDNVKFLRVYESQKTDDATKCESVYEILTKKKSGFYETNNKSYEVTAGFLKVPEDPKELWVMASKEDKEWSETVKSRAHSIFDDVFKVRVGVKSTADKVFIKEDWNQLDPSLRPEEELLRPLISSYTAERWVLPNETKASKVLYPHEVIDGKRQAVDLELFPKAKAYLEMNRETLEARTYLAESKTRHWYELWVPQDPASWPDPKVVFPDISSEAKFLIDTEGYVVDGNCYWLSLKNKKDEDLLYLAVAVANSAFMAKFHAIEFQNVLYSNKKRYLTQYVKNYPLPDPNSIHSKRLIELTKMIVRTRSKEEIAAYEKQIEIEVNQAFGF
ncbi:N-6 DNA methylase [Planococcus sp. S3-L1]|uniref:Eco57I restriction-modification methylase domain-containing protein n=1 Tax=Planococcus sp. S3-L1 TaxID=3046200 RepID=UPI0024B8D8B9|nr:N-6 DNA methylase [Planococcus sp. S3-L1]MDJ0333020.1 N-6 DNA methylase [Planococcus sp. S3-L1]